MRPTASYRTVLNGDCSKSARTTSALVLTGMGPANVPDVPDVRDGGDGAVVGISSGSGTGVRGRRGKRSNVAAAKIASASDARLLGRFQRVDSVRVPMG